MIGQTVGHYRITAKLGAGGRGVVYKAEDLKLTRPVALKVLLETVSREREALARLEREAQADMAMQAGRPPHGRREPPQRCWRWRAGTFGQGSRSTTTAPWFSQAAMTESATVKLTNPECSPKPVAGLPATRSFRPSGVPQAA